MCVWSACHLARDAVVHELDLAAVGQQDVAPLHVAVEAEVLLQVEEGVQHLHNTQRQPVGAFNQEKALVGASSMIVQLHWIWMDKFHKFYQYQAMVVTVSTTDNRIEGGNHVYFIKFT